MKRVFSVPLLFLISALLVIIAVVSRIDYHTLQLSVLLFLIVLLIGFQLFVSRSHLFDKTIVRHVFLFVITTFVNLLVVSTGGPASHFLLLASLFALAISLFLNIVTAFVFLVCFVVLLGVQIIVDPKVKDFISNDPALLILSLLMFVTVGSLAIVLNEYYHFKDVFVEALKKKIKQKEIHEQFILSHVKELILVTDRNLTIISVNEAVEKAVLLAKSELLNKHIFQSIFLKNIEGTFLTTEHIAQDELIQSKVPQTIEKLSLITKNGASRETFTLAIKPILDLENHVDQLLFILKEDGVSPLQTQEETMVLDQIITKQQAMIEEMRVTLSEKGLQDLEFKAALIGKIDREVRNLLELKSDVFDTSATSVNIARVSKNTCEVMQRFAKVLHVQLSCQLLNLGKEDIQHEVLADSAISADELTRSLYTAQVNLKWFDILLHKLIEISLLLSSTSTQQQVFVMVDRKDDGIYIGIKNTCTVLSDDEKEQLFALNYGSLQNKTNLKLASGLEGYIALQISEKMQLPLSVSVIEDGISFTMKLPV